MTTASAARQRAGLPSDLMRGRPDSKVPPPTSEFAKAFSYDPATGSVFRCGSIVLTRPNTTDGYRYTKFHGYRTPLHRLAFLLMTGQWPAGIVDHINRDRLDNRWGNLRLASRRQNIWNRHKAGRKFIGVECYGGALYSAHIQFEGRSVRIGTFDRAEDAAEAYDRIAWLIRGEFAVLNFPTIRRGRR